MNKLSAKVGIFSLLMGVTLYGWAGPCKPIAMSCMLNGYTKDGAAGKNLIKDCVLPVVSGKLVLPNTKFTQDQLDTCKTKLAEKIKDKMQNKVQQ